MKGILGLAELKKHMNDILAVKNMIFGSTVAKRATRPNI